MYQWNISFPGEFPIVRRCTVAIVTHLACACHPFTFASEATLNVTKRISASWRTCLFVYSLSFTFVISKSATGIYDNPRDMYQISRNVPGKTINSIVLFYNIYNWYLIWRKITKKKYDDQKFGSVNILIIGLNMLNTKHIHQMW